MFHGLSWSMWLKTTKVKLLVMFLQKWKKMHHLLTVSLLPCFSHHRSSIECNYWFVKYCVVFWARTVYFSCCNALLSSCHYFLLFFRSHHVPCCSANSPQVWYCHQSDAPSSCSYGGEFRCSLLLTSCQVSSLCLLADENCTLLFALGPQTLFFCLLLTPHISFTDIPTMQHSICTLRPWVIPSLKSRKVRFCLWKVEFCAKKRRILNSFFFTWELTSSCYFSTGYYADGEDAYSMKMYFKGAPKGRVCTW